MMVSLEAKEILSDPELFDLGLIILDHPSETRRIRKPKSLQEESNHI